MADKFDVSVVAPDRILFSDAVDHVISPGVDGEFGVLAHHAPFMTILKTGMVRILDAEQTCARFFVRGGFADVTSAGLTILAEEAIDMDDVNPQKVQEDINDLRIRILEQGSDDGQRKVLEERCIYLESLQTVLSGQA